MMIAPPPVEDDLVAGPVRRLAALLYHRAPVWPADRVPPLGHWLFFLPEPLQSTLGPDGHPVTGTVPVGAGPRRMWAGGRIVFHADLPIGARAVRTSHVERVETKTGRSGALTFVTLRHEVRAGDVLAIVEHQDLVYREAAETGQAVAPEPPAEARTAAVSRTLEIDAPALFRYSALTFNAHRIHYDLPYATGVEGYAGLVVHGPYQATLLVDHLLRTRPGARLATFAYRGVRPLFAGPATLNLAEEVDGSISLWTSDAPGHPCMRATATLVKAAAS